MHSLLSALILGKYTRCRKPREEYTEFLFSECATMFNVNSWSFIWIHILKRGKTTQQIKELDSFIQSGNRIYLGSGFFLFLSKCK